MPDGLFIVLDGPDGCGKSTQAARLVKRIRDAKKSALHLREPGGTPVGERIRDILLDSTLRISTSCEAFLFMAARAHLVEQTIEKERSRIDVVVCERWVSSTIAYQGWAGGFGVQNVLELAKLAVRGVNPNLIMILDVPPEVGLGRVKRDFDRMEQKGIDYHRKVRQGYEKAREVLPSAVMIDATRQEDAVAADIWSHVEKLL